MYRNVLLCYTFLSWQLSPDPILCVCLLIIKDTVYCIVDTFTCIVYTFLSYASNCLQLSFYLWMFLCMPLVVLCHCDSRAQ